MSNVVLDIFISSNYIGPTIIVSNELLITSFKWIIKSDPSNQVNIRNICEQLFKEKSKIIIYKEKLSTDNYFCLCREPYCIASLILDLSYIRNSVISLYNKELIENIDKKGYLLENVSVLNQTWPFTTNYILDKAYFVDIVQNINIEESATIKAFSFIDMNYDIIFNYTKTPTTFKIDKPFATVYDILQTKSDILICFYLFYLLSQKTNDFDRTITYGILSWGFHKILKECDIDYFVFNVANDPKIKRHEPIITKKLLEVLSYVYIKDYDNLLASQ